MLFDKLKFNTFLYKFFTKRNLIYLSIIALISLADILSKIYLHDFLNKVGGFYKLNEFINFVIVYNAGIVFGIFNNGSFFISKIFILIVFIVLLYVFYMIIVCDKKYKIPLSLIAGGGLGNLIEKIKNGYVFDFIDLHFKNFHWYVFNVADIFVCIGVSLMLLHEVSDFLKNRKKL